MTQRNVPIIITSSSQEEQTLELSIWKDQLGCSVLYRSTSNAYCSHRPLQSGTLANDVYYKNLCVAVVLPGSSDNLDGGDNVGAYHYYVLLMFQII